MWISHGHSSCALLRKLVIKTSNTRKFDKVLKSKPWFLNRIFSNIMALLHYIVSNLKEQNVLQVLNKNWS